MKKGIYLLVVMLCAALYLTAPAAAAEDSFDAGQAYLDDLQRAAPEEAEGLFSLSLSEGLSRIWETIAESLQGVLRKTLQGAVQLVLLLILCSVGESAYEGSGGKFHLATVAGALSIVLVSLGSFDQLMGLGVSTIERLNTFSKTLFPALAAATAASGMVGSAAVRQVTTVFCCDLLMTLINALFLPGLYLYVAALAAGAILGEGRLDTVAELLRKAIVWGLSLLLTGFSLYVSVSGALSQAADVATVRATKRVLAAALPVVGNLAAGAAEALVSGAGILKNTIGVFGVLAILAVCAMPFLYLGAQYLLYKLVAFGVAALAPPPLVKLVNGLGSAFGLLLGVTGSCALLMAVSVISSLLAVGG